MIFNQFTPQGCFGDDSYYQSTKAKFDGYRKARIALIIGDGDILIWIQF